MSKTVHFEAMCSGNATDGHYPTGVKLVWNEQGDAAGICEECGNVIYVKIRISDKSEEEE